MVLSGYGTVHKTKQTLHSFPTLDWAISEEWAYGGGLFHINCDYRLMIDNLMDLTHETYVHASSIGQKEIGDSSKGPPMNRFIQGTSGSTHVAPRKLDDYITDTNPVRIVDDFVDDLDLVNGLDGAVPGDTCRPAYHPEVLLKIYIYGCLNRIPLDETQ
ncbi:hypothetical protein SAMN03159488_03417 [Pseudomonas sp. NFIX10]|nr:hypothetical protein SAMN03159488_03417 [Pseudomonas sp. NFIX10]SFF47141.1 hypothetical protein SAMN03159367_04735 [Pseudomonas sp. NFACC06-1]